MLFFYLPTYGLVGEDGDYIMSHDIIKSDTMYQGLCLEYVQSSSFKYFIYLHCCFSSVFKFNRRSPSWNIIQTFDIPRFKHLISSNLLSGFPVGVRPTPEELHILVQETTPAVSDNPDDIFSDPVKIRIGLMTAQLLAQSCPGRNPTERDSISDGLRKEALTSKGKKTPKDVAELRHQV